MIPYLNFTQCLPSDVYTEARKAGADGERKNETITVNECGGVGASSIMEQTKGKSRTRGGMGVLVYRIAMVEELPES